MNTSSLNPGLLPIWRELARRLSRGDEPRRLTLRSLTVDQQAAVADLLGLDRLPGSRLSLRVDRLAAVLGVEGLDELAAMAEAATGPIVDSMAQREQMVAQRSSLWSDLEADLATVRWAQPTAIGRAVSMQQAAGVASGGIAARRELHRRLVAVLQALPADSTSRAVLSADLFGDPHALDSDTPLARLATQTIAIFAGLEVPTDSEARRAVWESVGVVIDQVSSNVLVLGLRVPASHGLSGQLNSGADAHEPVILTLSQLRRWPLPPCELTEPVLIVENPSIVESAAVRPTRGIARIVCSYGVPTLAVSTLLRQIGGQGAPLLQHSDFDPAGLVITNWLRSNVDTTPWKMSAADYLGAVESVRRVGRSIAGPIPASPWDPDLQAALDKHRVVISEEQLLDDLLAPRA